LVGLNYLPLLYTPLPRLPWRHGGRVGQDRS
jgi:hypothetical protein